MQPSAFADFWLPGRRSFALRLLVATLFLSWAPTVASTSAIIIEQGVSGTEAELCRTAVTLAGTRMGQIFPWLHARSLPRVRFFPSGVPGTAASPWVGGLYHASDHRIDIQHVPVLLRQGRLESTVQHEFVHAALALAGSARLPLWLEEGAAIYLSSQSLDETDTSVQPARTLRELENGLYTFGQSRTHVAWLHLKAYNRQARAIVAALIERNGLEHFTGFLRTLKNGTHLAQALGSWYSLAPGDLAAWL